MKKQKILVVYYSRTGNTQKIALELIRKLGADKEDLADLKDRKMGIMAWLISGKDAIRKKMTKIRYKEDPSKYDLVVIGTPVWAWTIPPAVRTYLSENKFKKVAFFCTNGGQYGKTFTEMEKLSQKPIATLDLLDKKVRESNFKEELNEFCEKLK